MNEDYAQLEKYLQGGLWRMADLETRKLLYVACGFSPTEHQQAIAVNQIPCDVLQTIDQLWLRYSRKRFGLSVQRQIWQACVQKYYNKTEALNQFGSKVGWRSGGLFKQTAWKKHAELTFKPDAPVGHLPHMGDRFGMFTLEALMKQLDFCSTAQPVE